MDLRVVDRFSRSETGLRFGAALGAVAICVAVYATRPSFFLTDDTQIEVLPMVHEIGHALLRGEWPWLTQNSWNATAIAGEHRFGTFSIFLLPLFALLTKLSRSPTATAFALSAIHLAILTAGTTALARARRLRRAYALGAAAVTAFNGYMLIWGVQTWPGVLTSFAWLPWFWWALHQMLRARESANRPRWAAAAAFFFYLLITAGWPFSDLMAVVVAGVAWIERPRRARRWAGRWITFSLLGGIALAAPAWLALIEYTASTLRNAFFEDPDLWRVPVRALRNLILPDLSNAWVVWAGAQLRSGPELAGGLSLIVGLAAGIAAGGRAFLSKNRVILGAAACCFALSTLRHPLPLRFPMRWLALFFLCGGLAAFAGWQRYAAWARQGGVAKVREQRLWQALLGALGFAAFVAGEMNSLVAIYVGLALLGAWIARRRSARPNPYLAFVLWFALATGLVAIWPLTRNEPIARWSGATWNDAPSALKRDRRYLWVGEFFDTYRYDNPFAGNSHLYRGIEMLNGYSPMRPAGLARVFFEQNHNGAIGVERARVVLEEFAAPDAVLAHLGVDGLAVDERFRDLFPKLTDAGWKDVGSIGTFTVFEREVKTRTEVKSVSRARAALPAVASDDRLWFAEARGSKLPILDRLPLDAVPTTVNNEVEFAPVKLRSPIVRRHQTRVQVEVADGDLWGMLAFERPWLPGFRASLNGNPLVVERLDFMMPAVRLPPGSRGELTLEYLPMGITIGLVISAFALITGLGTVALSYRGSGLDGAKSSG